MNFATMIRLWREEVGPVDGGADFSVTGEGAKIVRLEESFHGETARADDGNVLRAVSAAFVANT